MLSVERIKKSSIDSGYYLKQDGNYYIEDTQQKDLYQWVGKGAQTLGLVGDIVVKEHEAIYNGILPGNIRVGKRQANGTLTGRPGYDLTFSMNKDISLIVCCTEDTSLRDYFLNAHIHAVKTAMHEVEKMVSARKTTHGITEYEATKNMIASLCTHFSSRAGDPQIHTHALVANATQRADGQWRALSTDMQRQHGFYEKIRDHGRYLGHIYQHEMARAVKAKGFDIVPVNKHGMFAIQHFPDDVRKHFSKRRQQIVSIVESLHYADKKDKNVYSQVAQHSKAAKEKINHRDFIAKSKTNMQQFLALHHDVKDFDALLKYCRSQKTLASTSPTEKSFDAVRDAVNTLSRFRMEFDANTLLEKAMEFDLGSSSIPQLHASLNRWVQDKKLHRTRSGHFTSQALIARERRLLQQLHHTKREVKTHRPITSPTTVHEALKRGRLCMIEAPKTLNAKLKQMDAIIDDLESQGKKVTLLTYTKSLANDHNWHDKSRHNSLWQRLKRLGKADRAASLIGFLHQYDERTSNPISNALSRKGKEIFLVDEAQRLSLDAAEKVLALTEKRQANLIFFSYTQGRQNPLSGNIISLLKKAAVPIIKTPTRHADKQHPDTPITIQEVKTGMNAKAHEKQTERQTIIAEQVVKQFGERLTEVDVLTVTKQAALKQTALLRDALKQKGLIGKDEQHIITEKRVYLTPEERKHAKYFKTGWIVRTYMGRGQFSEKPIESIDVKNNRLLVRGMFGRQKYVSPQQICRDSESTLVEKSSLPFSHQDRIRLNTENRQSKHLRLSLNTSYQITLHDKKIRLVPDNVRCKTIKTTVANLHGLDCQHDYVRSVHQIQKMLRSNKKVVVDAPAYALNKNLINELSRHYSGIELYTDHQKKAEKKIGIQTHQPLAQDLTLASHQKERSMPQKAVDYGISVVGSREAAFTYQSVIKNALRYANVAVRFEAIQSELRARVQSGELMVRQTPTADILLATQATIDLEQSLITQIKSGKNTVKPFLSHAAIQQKLKRTTLTLGQKAACTLLATTRDRFVMVQGYAGTGKSTMLQTLQNALSTSGVLDKTSIIALAPTHKAVKALNEKGIEAQTLKRFLVDEATSENSDVKHFEDKLILLDESSMVSNRDFQQLQNIIEKAKTCHCAYIGDNAQLLSVENGKPSELAYLSAEANIAVATMDEVLRQKDPTLKAITQALLMSTPASVERAFTLLQQKEWIYDASTTKSEASVSPIQKIAEYYSALSPEERAQTVIAAATNAHRKAINHDIRIARQAKDELQGEVVSSTILTDSRFTDAELRHAPNYRKGDVVKLNNHYYDVVKTNHDTNTLVLKNPEEQNKQIHLDLLPTQATLALFHKETIDIQSGDRLKWTKTDKERHLTAHENLHVSKVNAADKTITVTSESGKPLILNLTHRNNQHIDYYYASTVHGLQGATAKSTLILLDHHNALSNTLRLLYVAITRSTHHVHVYTNNLKDVCHQILTQKGDKTSALEAMGLLDTKCIEAPNNKKPLVVNTHAPTKATHAIHPEKTRIDAKLVEDELRTRAQQICEALFGKPNTSLSHTHNWRYGSKGSLSIMVGGQHQGNFHNFETGEKGGMIQLLMSELALDFKSALEQGHRMLDDDVLMKPKPKSMFTVTVKDETSARKKAYITTLIKQSVPLKGSVAEKYLTHRAIKNTNPTDLRLIEKINTGKGNQNIQSYAAALLAIARGKDGEPKAVQLTYLDAKTGTKMADLKIPKRSIGLLKGASVNLTPEVTAPKITFVAEGIETALSIKDAMPAAQKTHAQVLATLGKSNLSNGVDQHSTNNIVLVLDNDKQNWRDDKTIQKAITQLQEQGKQVVCIQPTCLQHQKTDYNDLAKAGRFDDIRKDIMRGVGQIKCDAADINLHNKQPSQRIDRTIAKKCSADREIGG